jgi:hypothetical protein
MKTNQSICSSTIKEMKITFSSSTIKGMKKNKFIQQIEVFVSHPSKEGRKINAFVPKLLKE